MKRILVVFESFVIAHIEVRAQKSAVESFELQNIAASWCISPKSALESFDVLHIGVCAPKSAPGSFDILNIQVRAPKSAPESSDMLHIAASWRLSISTGGSAVGLTAVKPKPVKCAFAACALRSALFL